MVTGDRPAAPSWGRVGGAAAAGVATSFVVGAGAVGLAFAFPRAPEQEDYVTVLQDFTVAALLFAAAGVLMAGVVGVFVASRLCGSDSWVARGFLGLTAYPVSLLMAMLGAFPAGGVLTSVVLACGVAAVLSRVGGLAEV